MDYLPTILDIYILNFQGVKLHANAMVEASPLKGFRSNGGGGALHILDLFKVILYFLPW